MTREEAIKYLSEEQKKTEEVVALTERDFGVSESVWHTEYEAFNLAISALREQEEKEPCETCHFFADAREQDFGLYETIVFKFCPVCGRRLEEV